MLGDRYSFGKGRKVSTDNDARQGFLGASGSAGVLRTDSTLTYTDGGNYITLGVNYTTLDGRYYTETEIDAGFVSLDGEATNITNGTFDLTTTGDVFAGTFYAGGITGVAIGGGSGILTIQGQTGNQEDLVLDFVGTANTIGIASGSGVTTLNWNGLSFVTAGSMETSHLKSTGDIEIGHLLFHSGDTDNQIAFTTDIQTFYTSGMQRLQLSNDLIVFGNAGNDTDMVLLGWLKNAMAYDWGDDTFSWNSEMRIPVDNLKLRFGVGLTDLEIYSDGTNGIIDVATQLRLGNNVTSYTAISPTGNVLLPAGAAAVGRYPIKFQAGTALTTPEAGVINFVNSKFCITNVATCRTIDRSNGTLLETITVANTDVKTLLWTATMPANSLIAGNLFKFFGVGTGSNTANGVLTISIEVNDNEVASLSNTARNFTNDDIHIDALATQRTLNNGTNGERAFHVDLCIGDDCNSANGVATIDTEDTMDVKIYAKWDTANAANTFSFYQALMEYKN